MEKIKSIEDLLKNYQNYESFEDLLTAISFELHYKDPKLKAELTQPYVFTLEEFQKSVYYAYLAIQGKKENLIYLSEEEKTALRIKYKIEDGSDIIDTLLEFPEKFLEIFSKGFENMESKDKKTVLVVLIVFIFGYLTIDKIGEKIIEIEEISSKTELQEKNIEREEKLYDAFVNLKTKVGENPQYENKRQEAILKPVAEYKDNELVTKEVKITHDEAKKILSKKTLPKKIEEIIEGIYIVDGIRGLTKDKTTYYLTNNQEEIIITLGKSEKELPLRSKLLDNLNKEVKIKLRIVKENEATKEKVLESVEDIKNN